MSKDTGGPAFPGKTTINRATGEHQPYQFGNDDFEEPGMPLRDYAAIKAMQGICAHPDTWGLLVPEIAERAYQLADAMLAERAK